MGVGLLSFSSSIPSLSLQLPGFGFSAPKPKPFTVKMRERKKKKKKPMLMRLVSTAGTGFFYVVEKTMKRKRNDVKLELRKYDPRVKHHVLFTEEKMKR